MKKFISQIFVNKQKKNRTRTKRFHNFSSARSAGILFNASDPAVYSHAKSLLQFLGDKKIKTEGLGFAEKEQVDSFYKTYTGFNFFSKKDFNLVGVPKNQVVKDFIQQDFDILIDLSFSEEPLFTFICSLSNASFIVGSVKERLNEYDLMIEMGEETSVQSFINQLKHYLEIINVPSHE